MATMDPPWCPDCAVDVVAGLPACPRCAAPAASTPGPCPLAGGPVHRVVAPWAWTGTVAAVVRTGKLDRAPSVFAPLGRRLGEHVAGLDADDVAGDVVCPVPAHPRRRRQRGFDHAMAIARGVGQVLDLPAATLLTMSPRATDRGAGDAGSPHEWAARAQIVAREGAAVPPRVLLVDDVVTTATTVAAAATALRAGGARSVAVAALARAGRH